MSATGSAANGLRCDVLEPSTGQDYQRDPRSTARKAQTYVQSTGIGDRVICDNNKLNAQMSYDDILSLCELLLDDCSCSGEREASSQELLESSPLYRRLAKLQFREPEAQETVSA